MTVGHDSKKRKSGGAPKRASSGDSEWSWSWSRWCVCVSHSPPMLVRGVPSPSPSCSSHGGSREKESLVVLLARFHPTSFRQPPFLTLLVHPMLHDARRPDLSKRKSTSKDKDKDKEEDDPNKNEDDHPYRIGEGAFWLEVATFPLFDRAESCFGNAHRPLTGGSCFTVTSQTQAGCWW